MKVVKIHPEWDMNVYTNFHGNSSSICEDISLKTSNVNLREKS